MPPHRIDPRVESCPWVAELQPSSDAVLRGFDNLDEQPTLETAHHVGDVEGIHEGRALRQRQGKPGSAGWLGPFSGAGTHRAT